MENVNESLVSEAKLRMSMSVLVNIVETCDYNSRKSFKSILAAFTQFVSILFINLQKNGKNKKLDK